MTDIQLPDPAAFREYDCAPLYTADQMRAAIEADRAQRTVKESLTVDVDRHLDAVLRAAGSALKNYTMQKSLDDMRAAMREAMAAGALAQPTLTPEQEREAFEAWLLSNYDWREGVLNRDKEGRYTHYIGIPNSTGYVQVQHLWFAWKARAALGKGE